MAYNTVSWERQNSCSLALLSGPVHKIYIYTYIIFFFVFEKESHTVPQAVPVLINSRAAECSYWGCLQRLAGVVLMEVRWLCGKGLYGDLSNQTENNHAHNQCFGHLEQCHSLIILRVHYGKSGWSHASISHTSLCTETRNPFSSSWVWLNLHLFWFQQEQSCASLRTQPATFILVLWLPCCNDIQGTPLNDERTWG